jgi:hypothetical protein
VHAQLRAQHYRGEHPEPRGRRRHEIVQMPEGFLGNAIAAIASGSESAGARLQTIVRR